MECEAFDLRTRDYEVQRHYERIRKPCFVKIAVNLRCNNTSVAANCNVGDVERDVVADKLFIAPFFYGRNSVILLPFVS